MKPLKALLLMLALLLALTLIACNGQLGGEQSQTPDDNQNQTNNTQGGSHSSGGQQNACANGHTPGAWVVDKPATLDEAGQKHRVCTICGTRESEEIAKLIPSEGLAYEVNEDGTTCTITGIGTCTDTDLVIPKTINGYTVTGIGYTAFYECTGLTSVVIPDSVTSIGYGAFYGCSGLTSVVIGDGVEEIGEEAFYYCTSLTSVVIGDSVTSIGYSAFYNCTNLTKVVISDLAAWCNIRFGDYSATPLYYGGHLYLGENEITELVIPDSVTSIGSYAFYNCDGLTSVVIGDSVTSIGRSAFEDCTGLTSVVIGDGVTSIGEWAFLGCTSLTSVVIPDGVTSIGNYAFSGCYKLVEVYNLSPHITVIKGAEDNGWLGYYALNVYTPLEGASKLWTTEDGYIFYEDGDTRYLMGYTGEQTDLVLPENCHGKSYGIYKCAFCYRDELTSVVIPDSVTSIGEGAFLGCTSLTSVVIPDGVTSIGEGAFAGCNALESLTVASGNSVYHSVGNCIIHTASKTLVAGCKSSVIPTDGNVTSIGEYAFHACNSLTSVVIPDSVTSIGEWAFLGCTSLTSVVIPDSVESLGSYAFASCTNLSELTIGNSVRDIGNYAFFCCYSLTSVVIPDSVTSIGDYAFQNCSSLTSVVIPDSVESLGSDAFAYCTNLSELTIGNSVRDIGDRAFRNCTGLTSVVIPDSVTSIGYEAFYNCSSLTSVVIGNGVEQIGEYAFYYCRSLTSVVIGDSVTSIGREAFRGCDKLVEVYNLSPHITVTKGDWYWDNGYLGRYALDVYTSLDTPSKLWTTEDGYIFYEDGNTCYLVGYTGEQTDLVLPENCHGKSYEIYNYAFCDRDDLTSVVIGDGVTSIGEWAFLGCTSLTSVYYAGGESEWNDISIDDWSNSNLTSATRYYYSASEPTTEGNYWRYVNGVPTAW